MMWSHVAAPPPGPPGGPPGPVGPPGAVAVPPGAMGLVPPQQPHQPPQPPELPSKSCVEDNVCLPSNREFLSTVVNLLCVVRNWGCHVCPSRFHFQNCSEV